jgi:hypothetical protein
MSGVVRKASRKWPFSFFFYGPLTEAILSSALVFLLSSDFFGVKLELSTLPFLLISEFPMIMFTEYLS